MVTPRGDAGAKPLRLIPRWYAACVLTLFGVVTCVGLVATVVEDGAVALAWGFATAAGVLFLVAAVVALVWPRRRRTLTPGPDGSLVIASPAVLVWTLLGSWLFLLCSGAVWIYLAVTDFSRISEAGPIVVVIIGTIASLPELVRLLTGRLHRWRLTLTRDGFTYQGYRRAVSEPWRAVHGATTVRGKNAGVVLDLKAARPDLVIPATLFLLDPAQIVEEISTRISTRG